MVKCFVKKFFPAPKLRDVVKKLVAAGMTQPEIARRVYGAERKQGKISLMMNASDGSTWEKHWQIFAKFIPLALDRDVITERDLLGLSDHESSQDHGSTKAGRSKTDSRE